MEDMEEEPKQSMLPGLSQDADRLERGIEGGATTSKAVHGPHKQGNTHTFATYALDRIDDGGIQNSSAVEGSTLSHRRGSHLTVSETKRKHSATGGPKTENRRMSNPESFSRRKNRVRQSQEHWAGLSTLMDMFEEFEEEVDAPDYRKELARKLDGPFGVALELGSSVVSVFAVSLYTATCVYEEFDEEHQVFYLVCLCCIALIYAADYGLRFYVSINRTLYIRSMVAVVDLVTMVPVWIDIIASPLVTDLYPARAFAKWLWAFEVMRVHRVWNHLTSEVPRQLCRFSYLLGCSVYVASVLLYHVEKNNGMNLLESGYLVLITTSTVGYGDFSPTTWEGKLLMILTIAFTFVMVPHEMNVLITLLSHKSLYARTSFQPRAKQSHIVVCGHITAHSASRFLEEFYHEDHGNTEMMVVLLNPITPRYDMQRILKSAKYSNRVKFVEGSPIDSNDVQRCSMQDAKACFLLSNRLVADPAEEDASNILRALHIKHLTSGIGYTSLTTYLQLIRPESKATYAAVVSEMMGKEEAKNRDPGQMDQIVCMDEMKFGLMGQSCLSPAYSTLVGNLITTTDDEKPNSNGQTVEEWEKEYCYGCGFEIYRTSLSPHFSRKPFYEIASVIYQEFGSLLFALELKDKYGEKHVVLYPHSFLLNKASTVVAFIIAPDSTVVKKVATYNPRAMSKSGSTFRASSPDGQTPTVNPLDKPTPTMARALKAQVRRSVVKSVRMVATLASGDKVNPLLENEVDSPTAATPPAGANHEAAFSSAGTPFAWQEPNGFAGEAPRGWDLVREMFKRHPGSLAGAVASEARWEDIMDLAPRPMKYTGINLASKLQELIEQVNRVIQKFHTRSPCSLNEATIENCLGITGHIVVCGMVATDLYHFIAPLRRNHLGSIQPIVILTPPRKWTFADHKMWNKISIFADVYIMFGYTHDPKDLRMANIEEALSVVILAPTIVKDRPDESVALPVQESLLDAETIFAFQHIRRFSPHSNVLADIISPANIAFLVPSDREERDAKIGKETHMMVPYVTGWVFTSSMLDTLICQAFYNHDLLAVLRQLVSSGEGTDTEIEMENNMKMRSAFVSQITVGDEFLGWEFGQYLDHFLYDRKMLCIGLYRAPNADKGNYAPYVYTNPKASTILCKGDAAFFLASAQPHEKLAMLKSKTSFNAASGPIAESPAPQHGRNMSFLDRSTGMGRAMSASVSARSPEPRSMSPLLAGPTPGSYPQRRMPKNSMMQSQSTEEWAAISVARERHLATPEAQLLHQVAGPALVDSAARPPEPSSTAAANQVYVESVESEKSMDTFAKVDGEAQWSNGQDHRVAMRAGDQGLSTSAPMALGTIDSERSDREGGIRREDSRKSAQSGDGSSSNRGGEAAQDQHSGGDSSAQNERLEQMLQEMMGEIRILRDEVNELRAEQLDDVRMLPKSRGAGGGIRNSVFMGGLA